MWSRKPTPVARVARAGAVERQRQAHVRLAGARSIVAVRLMWAPRCSSTLILAHARLHRLGVHVEALRAGDRRARRASFSAPRADRAPRTCVRRKWRGESAEAKRAAPPGRQHVVGAGDVVAERGRAVAPTNRQPALRTCGASASTSAPISCRCSGANALASADRLAGGRRPGRCANAASPTVGRSTHQRLERRRQRVADAAREGDTATTRLPSPCSAWASMSSAPAELRAVVGAPRRRRRAPRAGRWGRRSRRSRRARRAGAWPPARRGCRDRRSRRRARPCRCRRRARRSPARRPCGTRARRRTAGTSPRITGSICPSRPGGAHTATSSDARRARGHDAHHDRARVRGAPAGHVHGGGAHGHLAQRRRAAPAPARLRRRRATPASATRATFAIATCSPAIELQRQLLDRLVELLRCDAQRPRLAAGGVEAASCTRARPRRPRRAPAR